MDRTRSRNIATMISGTVGAQIVFIAATPLLTRIYSNVEIGMFGLFMSTVLTVGKICNLKYDSAIPLEKNELKSQHIFHLSIACAIVSALFLSLLYLGATYFGLDSVVEHPLYPFFLIILFSVVLFVFHESLMMCLIREARFRLISSVRFLNASVVAVVQLAGGLFASKLLFLMLAIPVSLISGALIIFGFRGKHSLIPVPGSLKQYREVAKTYNKFPRFATPNSLVYELSGLLPMVCLSSFGYVAAAGHFYIARRIGLLPSSVLGRSIAQVNQSELADLRRQSRLAEALVPQIRKLQWALFIPAVILATVAPYIATVVLGDDWVQSGRYLQYFAVYVYLRVVFSPTNNLQDALNKQNFALLYEGCGTLLALLVMVFFCFHGEVEYAVHFYFLLLSCTTILFKVGLLRFIEVKPFEILSPTLVQLPVLLLAMLLSQQSWFFGQS